MPPVPQAMLPGTQEGGMTISFRGRAAETPGGTELPPAAIAAAGTIHRFHTCQLPAILDVECGGEGFLPDGRPKILFEAHWFHRLTDGRFTADHPAISSPVWTRDLYWGGAGEYVRLARAMALDEAAALKSASWGLPQILGLNHRAAGFVSVQAMVRAFADDPVAHLNALTTFMQAKDQDDLVRAWDWTGFARSYNGPGFATHRYHLRLALAAARNAGIPGLAFGAVGMPVRNLQAALKFAGHDPGALDGAVGPRTAAALLTFQAAERAPFPPEAVR